MKRPVLALGLLTTALLTSAGGVRAQGSRAGQAKPAATDQAKPFHDYLKRGEDAYLARNFDAAIQAFQSALDKEPNNPLGHYRMGEALRAAERYDDAEKAWTRALQFAGRDVVLKAKVLFVLADLRERQKNYAEAIKAWDTYSRFVTQQKNANGYPKTAGERKKRNEDIQKLLQDYAAVKDRIEKRLKEVDENARKSSK